MYTLVDDFCDEMGNEPEGAQMEAALAEMEEELSEDICEFIEDHIQENLPKCLEESSPFLPEARQGVRRRIQRPSVSARLEGQNPEESIWARALQRLHGILQSLQQWCWDALTWLREKAAPWLKEKATAFLEAICSAVRAVWGVLMDFCSSWGSSSETSSRSRSPRWFWRNSTSSRRPAPSPSRKPSCEATFTLLLTLDPSFNCPHLLSCRDDTTASGQVSLLQV
uniref:Interleukin 32 n=1 Tax=Bos mutus grunniens TaxID=30521 RepID=A0A8B9YPX8_BOSMU